MGDLQRVRTVEITFDRIEKGKTSAECERERPFVARSLRAEAYKYASSLGRFFFQIYFSKCLALRRSSMNHNINDRKDVFFSPLYR